MTTAPHFVVTDSARDPDADIWFAEPEGFTPIPLDALLTPPGSPAADNLRAVLAPFLDAAPDEKARQQFIAQMAQGRQLLGALCEIGTVHCSIGLHRDDIDDAGNTSGQPLLALFTLSWRDTALAPRAVTAARAVTSAAGHTRIEYLELPCGPATVSETVLIPQADRGLPQMPLLQIHAHLPHPDCKRLVVLALSTTAGARREQYRTILRQIAELVSFENPLEPEASVAS
ncbi:hypothetical protein [Streptomyces sp. NBC_00203]|uniref:hypothetical protein n=1 Tax=Streptomyces sp. NBC_00203 TaxID=2975680 RepID=UPI00324ECB5D